MKGFWLVSASVDYLRWLRSASNRALASSTMSFAGAVSASFVSGIALTVAFFLPLKVAILLGSPSIPAYFVEFFGIADRDQLVLVLSLGIVTAYTLYLVLSYAFDSSVASGTTHALSRAKKLTQYGNEDAIARGLYGRLGSSIASCLYIGLGFALGLWLYTTLFVGLILIFLTIYGVMVSILNRAERRDVVAANASGYLNILSGISFLLFFAVLIGDYLISSEIVVFSAIIGLVVGRQITQRTAAFAIDAVQLTKSRYQFNSLFYTAPHYQVDLPKSEKAFWDLLSSVQCVRELEQALDQALAERVTVASYSWMPLGLTHMAGLRIELDNPRWQRRPLLLKIFGDERKAAAGHEVQLFSQEWSYKLPAPRFISETRIRDYSCLVCFSNDKDSTLISPAVVNEKLESFVIQSWSVRPGVALSSQFLRTKPSLAQRMTSAWVEKLKVVARSDLERFKVDEFASYFTALCNATEELPLVIHNPDFGQNSLFLNEEGEAWCRQWSRWQLEPVGYGWPYHSHGIEQLQCAFDQLSSDRPELADVDVKLVYVVAMLTMFERHVNAYSFIHAIEMLPEMNGCLRECNCVKSLSPIIRQIVEPADSVVATKSS